MNLGDGAEVLFKKIYLRSPLVLVSSGNYNLQLRFWNVLKLILHHVFRHISLPSHLTGRPSFLPTYPIHERILALGEYSFALPPNRISDGPHGHSLCKQLKKKVVFTF